MRRTAIGFLLLGVLLAGCGIEDPYATDEREQSKPRSAERQRPVQTATDADATHAGDAEQLQPAPRPEVPKAPASGGAPSASEAASLYTRTFTNWTWRDVADRSVKILAPLAGGELHELVLGNAQELRDDTTLRRDRAANRGTLVAIDQQGGDPARRIVWVVMRETASTAGLTTAAEQSLTVYRLTVERLRGTRWYVTGFEPQA
jgi:hypothetical protein